MMVLIAQVVLWWLPSAGAFAGLPFLSAGLRSGLSLAALLWFAGLQLIQLQARWWQNPWAFDGLGVQLQATQAAQPVASAVLIFVGLRLLPSMSALAMRSLGAADEDSSGLEDGASTPETSVGMLYFVLLFTLAVLSDESGGLVGLILPGPGTMDTPLPSTETTAIASWLMELLQQSVAQAIDVVAPFLMGGVLADLIVLSVRGARRARSADERWRPVWVLGVLMLVTSLGLTPNARQAPSRLDAATTAESAGVP